MGKVSLISNGDGRIQLSGEITFDSVMEVCCKDSMMADVTDLEVDLGGVTRSDSAGLALLVDWMRTAHRLHKNITFSNIPVQMLAMAKVSGLDKILPLVGTDSPKEGN